MPVPLQLMLTLVHLVGHVRLHQSPFNHKLLSSMELYLVKTILRADVAWGVAVSDEGMRCLALSLECLWREGSTQSVFQVYIQDSEKQAEEILPLESLQHLHDYNSSIITPVL